MGTQRVSQKDVLSAIENQTASIDALVSALTASAIDKPVATEQNAPTKEAISETDISVDDAYLQHMTAKAADHATAKGETVVLYARRNKANETKLAYALQERYDTVVSKQPSCLGPIGSFKA